MGDEEQAEEQRVASRTASLQAEEGVEVDEAETQAEAILEDSDEREDQASRPGRGGALIEHRRSEDTVEPPE